MNIIVVILFLKSLKIWVNLASHHQKKKSWSAFEDKTMVIIEVRGNNDDG